MRSVVEIGASVPAFLAKLWKLVDDPDTDHLIAWSPGGKMFNIQNQAEFARELLPLYYKHNNMASFIRQLNMYGFHKVTSVDNGGLKAEKDEIEFCHPCFLQGHAYLLEHIKRKIAHPKQIQSISDEKSLLKPEVMNKVLVDVKQIKGKQESLDARFSVMKHENEALWREVALLRQKHIKQQQIVNNLIQFLMSLVQSSRGGPLKTGVKRRYQLMINNAAHNSSSSDTGRQSKDPRLENEAEFDMNDLTEEEDNGPIIHEVAEQDRLSECDSVRNILLCSDPDARSSVSPGTAPSPAFSAPSPAGQDILATTDDSGPMEYPSSFDPLAENSMDIPLADKAMDSIFNENIVPLTDGKRSSVGSSKRSTSADKVSPSLSVPVASAISSTQPTPTLPTNIFEGDEANSQDGTSISLNEVDQQAAISALQNATEQMYIDPSELSDIDFINSMTTGTYNPNVNLNSTAAGSPVKGKKKKESNKQNDEALIRNIKEEVLNPDEEDWSNMTLATVPNDKRPSLHRFQSVEDVDDHLEAMQADLESIKHLLRGENYSLDANALLTLFSGDEPLYNLPMNPSDLTLDKSKDTVGDSSGQLMSYTSPAPLFDFDDIELDEADSLQAPSDDIPLTDVNDSSSTLNTPQMSLQAPDFPAKK